MHGCKYCANDPLVELCGQVHPSTMKYGCTRPVGHTGFHVACGVSSHMIARWLPQRNKPQQRNPRT
jgi:hypothetical protein